ncbi:MAG: hypothetical protein CK426_01150 [Legionella sp.]|nr:MAG: hypothetical protein CK423_08415 [Legionella sp.]PJD99911.1 MAG: hypothetical protein CK426_01150 [Legionella sp.]
MTQIFTGSGLGLYGSSLRLGHYGPRGSASLGQGKESVYLNIATGNLVVQQQDGFLADASLGMNLLHTYNSQGGAHASWRFNLQTSLVVQGSPNGRDSKITRTAGDGHQTAFYYDSNKQAYYSLEGGIDRISWRNNQWVYSQGASVVEEYYNEAGQLTRIADKEGHYFQFVYSQGVLTEIVDQSDKQSIRWILRDGLVREVRVVSEGVLIHHLEYHYNERGQLAQVSRDLGQGKTYWISYEYEADTDWIKTIRQSDGSVLHITYDRQGRVTKLRDGEGRTTSYRYEVNKTIVSNELDEQWVYYYNESQQLLGIDGPQQYRIRYQYDGALLHSVTEGKQSWLFFYNDNNDCIRIEESNGQVTRRYYDANHHLLMESSYEYRDKESQSLRFKNTRYAYDKAGYLRFLIQADGTVTEYRYDRQGLLSSTRVYLKTAYDVLSLDSETLLDEDSLKAWVGLQPAQDISLVDYRYDWRGQLLEEIHYAQTDASGQGIMAQALVSRFLYDAAGRLLEKSTPYEGSFSTTYYFYDDLGRLIKTIDNQNHQQDIEYDDAHQRIVQTDANGLQTIQIFDRSGLLLAVNKIKAAQEYGSVSYQYDAAGRLLVETNEKGSSIYRFYTAEGLLQGLVNSAGQAIEYHYDAQGLLLQTHHYATLLQTMAWTRIPLWEQIKPRSTDRDKIEHCIYDEHNRLAYRINAEGGVIAYEYDVRGLLITSRAYAIRGSVYAQEVLSLSTFSAPNCDDEDRVTRYYYDSEERLCGEINPEGYAKAYQYDKQGHLIQTIRYAKAVQKVTGDWVFDKPAAHFEDIKHAYFYDGRGLLCAEVDEEYYAIEYVYDERGLLAERIAYANRLSSSVIDLSAPFSALRPVLSEKDQHSHYRYDDLKQLIEEQSYNGLLTTYTYDEAGHLLAKTRVDIKTQETRQQRYRYDAMGRVIQSLDELGALALAKAYDEASIERIWQTHGMTYDYDESGLLLSKTDALGQKTSYFYDDLSRLVYVLDADGALVSYQYNTFNELARVHRYRHYLPMQDKLWTKAALEEALESLADELQDEVIDYQYNTLGLLTEQYNGSVEYTRHRYNAFGQLEKVEQRINAHTSVINQYRYNHQGELISSIEDVGGFNRTKQFRYDGFGRLKYQIDARGNMRQFSFNKRGEETYTYKESHAQTGKYNTILYDAFGRITYKTEQEGYECDYDDVNNRLITTYLDGVQVITQYNAFGDKVSVTDGNGHTTEFQYDVKGQLRHTKAPAGLQQDYEYDAMGHLVFSTNAQGIITAYSYDASGRVLTEVRDTKGVRSTTIYKYDALGHQIRRTNANGVMQSHRYNAQGRLVETILDPEGLHQITRYEYDDRGLLIRQTQKNSKGLDKVIAYEWDNLGRQTAIIHDPEGLQQTRRYGYDANGNLVVSTDANGHSTHYAYDVDNQCRYEVSPRQVVTEYVYNDKGLVKHKTVYAKAIELLSGFDEQSVKAALRADEQHDQHQFFFYDRHQRITEYFDALGYCTFYRYDKNGNLLSKTQAAQAVSIEALKRGAHPMPDSLDERIEYYLYDEANQLRFQWSKGVVTEFGYNSLGQLISKTHYAQQMFFNREPCTITDLKSLLERSSQDRTTRYAYNSLGYMDKELSAEGVAKSYTYDALGQLIASTHHALLCAEAPADLQTVEFKKQANDRSVRFVYNAAGQERFRISSEGRVIERQYDEVGNTTCEIHHKILIGPGLEGLSALEQYYKDSEGSISWYQYNALGQKVWEENSGQQSTEYRYDLQGNLTEKIQANKAVWNYFYNESNQLVEIQAPEVLQGQSRKRMKTCYSYDSFGNLTQEIKDAEGIRQIRQYGYDNKNQRTQTIYPGVALNAASDKASSQRQEFTQSLSEEIRYNAFGQVIAQKDKAGHWSYSWYNELGHLVYAVNRQGAVTAYQYTTSGEVRSKTQYATALVQGTFKWYGEVTKALSASSHDRISQMEYNKDGLLIEITHKAVRSYDPVSNEYSMTLKPKTKTYYNAFGEVVQVSSQINAQQCANTFYYYDKDGKKTAELNAEQYITTYQYDALGFLKQTVEWANRVSQFNRESYQNPIACTKDRTVWYDYDALGHLTQKTLKNARVGKQNEAGAYGEVTQDLVTRYTYDALGHLTSTTDAKGHVAFSYYDALGQLIAQVGPATKQGKAATTYVYDALGHLLETRRWANGALEADENHFVLGNASKQDQVTSQRYDAQGLLQEQTDAMQQRVYYSYDAQGNVARRWQIVTQRDGTQVAQDCRYSYDSEGHLIETKTFKTEKTYKTEEAKYNLFGEIVSKGVNGLNRSQTEYDTQGRVWRTNSQGYYQIYVYDLMGRVTQVVTKSNGYLKSPVLVADLGSEFFEKAPAYDNNTWYWDLQRQNTTYDALGRIIGQSKVFSAEDKVTKQLILQQIRESQQVDCWGNMTSFINYQGHETRYEYNDFNKLIKKELPEIMSMNAQGVRSAIKPVYYYYYDELGQAIAMTDANQHTVSKAYDAMGQLVKETDAKGGVRSKNYNLLGQMTSLLNELQGETLYLYDANNRLLKVETKHSQQTYAYDELGQLVKQTNGEQESTYFSYDRQGHLIHQENAQGQSIWTTYDDEGHKKEETNSLGHKQSWRYNSQGLLEEHVDLGQHRTTYQYNANGLLEQETSSAGKDIHYRYRGDGALIEYADKTHNETLLFEYNKAGQLIERTSSRGGDAKGWNREFDFYEYDALGRISRLVRKKVDDVDASQPSQDNRLLSVSYDYDAAGNIRHTSTHANYTGYEVISREDYFLYDENDRMTVNQGQLRGDKIEISSNQGSALSYDAAGNIRTARQYENAALKRYDYQYNTDNQLELMQENGQSTQWKKYDKAGRVIEEHLFNKQGQIAQYNFMHYEKGQLKAQQVKNQLQQEQSLTTFAYDAVGNMRDMHIEFRAQGRQIASSLHHHYTYSLWDNYQQEEDQACRTERGQNTYGKSRREYDSNGLLKESVDEQKDERGRPNSVQYWNSGVDGIKARADKNGLTHYLHLGNKTIGDLHLSADKKQRLTVYGGFMPEKSGSSSTSAQSTSQFLDRKAQEVTEDLVPSTPQDQLGSYTIQSSDSLEGIALQVYGDSSLWYLIADANGLTCGKSETAQSHGALHLGQRLVIPPVATGQHHTSSTKKIIKSEYFIGNTSATTKAPLPIPPPLPKKHNQLLAKIIVGVVATVATLLTAGIAGALSGIAGSSLFTIGSSVLAGAAGGLGTTIGASFAAGVVGNLAGQAMANAFKLQEGMNVKGALVNGLLSAATSGVLGGVNQIAGHNQLMNQLGESRINTWFNLQTAAQTMEYNAASQGLSQLAHHQNHFEWDQFAVSAITAGLLGSDSGRMLQQTLRKIDYNSGILASELNALVHDGINSATTGATFDAKETLTNNLGQAVGNGVMETIGDNIEQEATITSEGSGEKKTFNTVEELNDAINALYGTKLDFKAFEWFEGKQQTRGYLPMIDMEITVKNKDGSTSKRHIKKFAGKSGITIARGFDVGQHNAKDLKKYKFSSELEKKLLPFVGKVRGDAKKLIPLAHDTILTQAEIAEIDYAVITKHIKYAINSWNDSKKPPGTPKFQDLCFVKQTILISRTYNVGPGMPRVMKDFYIAARNNDWKKARYFLEKDTTSNDKRIKKELAFFDYGHEKDFKYS